MASNPTFNPAAQEMEHLQKKYEELQLRVTRFSATEQELIHARNRLDREVMIYRRMQEFNSQALQEMTDQEFLTLVTESLIDIFEVEIGYIAIELGNSTTADFQHLEGYTMVPAAQPKILASLKKMMPQQPLGKVRQMELQADQDELYKLIPLRHVFVTCVKNPEPDMTIYLMGGITDKGSSFYDPIGSDREAAFLVFGQQVMAHETNYYKTQTIKQQLHTLSQEQKRITSIAESFLSFDTDPDQNIQKIVSLSVSLLSASSAVYENLHSDHLVHSGNFKAVEATNGGESQHQCNRLVQLSKQPIVCYPNLSRELLSEASSWIHQFQGYTFLGSSVIIDKQPVGTLAIFLNNHTAITDNILQLTRILSAAIAVEERRKRALNALQESEEKYRIIFDGSPSGIIVADSLSFRIYYSNPALCALFDYSQEEFMNMTLEQLHPKESLPEIKTALERIIKGKKVVGQDIACLRKDGSTFFADIFSNTILLGGRNLVTGFFTDVTQRHENQEALLSSNAELKKINTELDNFVYSVSHDLRSPLLAIQGLIQLINSPASSDAENTRNYLSMVNASINRMDDTIKEILEYSRNARLAVQKEEIDFRKLVEGIFDDVKHIYPNSIDLELIIDCEYPFYSDPFRITTLFKNIISNAVKYQRRGPEQSFVKIHICADPEKVKLRFEDNGEGIGPEHLDKIFDMFYRASNSSVGTGLGLYICREIVNNLGGQISAASIPGKGSVFTVVLDNLNH